MSTTRKTKAAPAAEKKPAVKAVRKKAAEKPPAAKKPAVKQASGKSSSAAPAGGPSDEEIAALAYELWEQAGRPDGRSEEHWREAEARLRGAKSGS